MKSNVFFLRVKVGSLIISSTGDYKIEGVPADALHRIKKGCTWLGLTKESAVELQKLSEPELNNLKSLRKKQGFLDDVAIIDMAIKSKNNVKKK